MILRNVLENIICKGQIELVDNEKVELLNEIYSMSCEISEYGSDVSDLYRLSKDLNICFVMIRPSSDSIIVKSNCLAYPITLYFYITQDSEFLKLDLLFRDFDVVCNEGPWIEKIQKLNYRLKIISNKYFSENQDPNKPDSLGMNENHGQIIEENKNFSIINNSIKPNIPESFPVISRSICINTNAKSDVINTTKGPSENINFRGFTVPNKNIFELYPKDLLNLKKHDKNRTGVEGLESSMQISHVALLKPLEFKPKVFEVKLPAESLFPDFKDVDEESVGSLLDLSNSSNNEEIKEMPMGNKSFEFIETCLNCKNREFLEMDISCRCSMCIECLNKSQIIRACKKCSFSLKRSDLNLLNSIFGSYNYY